MTKKQKQDLTQTFSDFIYDIDIKAATAFGVAMIALLLVYIAFFR